MRMLKKDACGEEREAVEMLEKEEQEGQFKKKGGKRKMLKKRCSAAGTRDLN